MVFRVRQVTPDNNPHHLDTDNMEDMELDYDPDESEIVSDPEEYLEEGESGFISHITGQQADSR